ncbi:MAG: peptide chain release factor N(5)-glutamine methyltransferase [Proteobacteria bacterium]|nr:peptide chain release factor N(5)-glutamine methyltransferase [Pseudomonadota bacterium]
MARRKSTRPRLVRKAATRAASKSAASKSAPPSAAATAPRVTVAIARRRLADLLRAAGCENPQADARLLMGHALGLDHAALVAAAARELPPACVAEIAALAARRGAGEPIARIRGHREFWDMSLAVSADVLLPRPESETVVEEALALLGEARARALRIADIGTGSGALLLALLTELPGARGIGTDCSHGALAIARTNAGATAAGARAAFVACDFGAALGCAFDLVVSNPPYIPSGDIAGLDVDVRAYDPLLALDGGRDGLDAYRAIAADAPRLIAPGGLLVLEIGIGQEARVRALLIAAGLAPAPAARNDLAGRPRALAAWRNP